ncbi:MAG TPA: LCCL domain-containing protein [Polyangia bacterium]|jgi:hypothetical protein
MRTFLLSAAVVILEGCTIAASPLGLPVTIAPPPITYSRPPAAASGGPIEAGCSFNAGQLQGGPGAVFQVGCPPGCESTGGLWGTDVYTADSSICRAGIHAGAISPGGGVVTVRIEPGRPAYRGTARNGLASNDYGSYPRSYAVLNGSGPPADAPPPGAPQAIEAGCSFSSMQIQDAPGAARLVSCPPGCSTQGGLWGSDVYTGDSGICRAAIHSGFLSDAGGMVVVVLDVGRPAYRGSARNGITSSDYGNFPKSFRLQRP